MRQEKVPYVYVHIYMPNICVHQEGAHQWHRVVWASLSHTFIYIYAHTHTHTRKHMPNICVHQEGAHQWHRVVWASLSGATRPRAKTGFSSRYSLSLLVLLVVENNDAAAATAGSVTRWPCGHKPTRFRRRHIGHCRW
jgi:hypothetical protein